MDTDGLLYVMVGFEICPSPVSCVLGSRSVIQGGDVSDMLWPFELSVLSFIPSFSPNLLVG